MHYAATRADDGGAREAQAGDSVSQGRSIAWSVPFDSPFRFSRVEGVGSRILVVQVFRISKAYRVSHRYRGLLPLICCNHRQRGIVLPQGKVVVAFSHIPQ